MAEDQNINQDIINRFILGMSVNVENAAEAVSHLENLNTNLSKTENAFLKTSEGVKRLYSGFTSIIQKSTTLIGNITGVNTSVGISATRALELNKNIILLSNSFSKYGVGVSSVISKLDSTSKALRLTKDETQRLFKEYEKGFPVASLESASKILSNIKNITGANADAIGGVQASLSQLLTTYPTLQSAVENLTEADKDRLNSIIKTEVISGRMGIAQARALKEYINQSGQISEKDKKIQDELIQRQESLGKIKKAFEDIALVVGEQLIPFIKTFGSILEKNAGLIKVTAASFATIAIGKGIAKGASTLSTIGKGVGTILGKKDDRFTNGRDPIRRTTSIAQKVSTALGYLGKKDQESLTSSSPDGSSTSPFYVISKDSISNNPLADLVNKLRGKSKDDGLDEKVLGSNQAKDYFTQTEKVMDYGLDAKSIATEAKVAKDSLKGILGTLSKGTKFLKSAGGITSLGVGAVLMAGQYYSGSKEKEFKGKSQELKEQSALAKYSGEKDKYLKLEEEAKSYEDKAKKYNKTEAALGVTGATLTGAGIGSMVPVIGTAVGALAGLGVGLATAAVTFEDADSKLGKSIIGIKYGFTSLKDSISSGTSSLFNSFKGSVSTVFDGISDIVSSGLDKYEKFLDTGVGKIFGGAIRDVFVSLGEEAIQKEKQEKEKIKKQTAQNILTKSASSSSVKTKTEEVENIARIGLNKNQEKEKNIINSFKKELESPNRKINDAGDFTKEGPKSYKEINTLYSEAKKEIEAKEEEYNKGGKKDEALEKEIDALKDNANILLGAKSAFEKSVFESLKSTGNLPENIKTLEDMKKLSLDFEMKINEANAIRKKLIDTEISANSQIESGLKGRIKSITIYGATEKNILDLTRSTGLALNSNNKLIQLYSTQLKEAKESYEDLSKNPAASEEQRALALSEIEKLQGLINDRQENGINLLLQEYKLRVDIAKAQEGFSSSLIGLLDKRISLSTKIGSTEKNNLAIQKLASDALAENSKTINEKETSRQSLIKSILNVEREIKANAGDTTEQNIKLNQLKSDLRNIESEIVQTQEKGLDILTSYFSIYEKLLSSQEGLRSASDGYVESLIKAQQLTGDLSFDKVKSSIEATQKSIEATKNTLVEYKDSISQALTAGGENKLTGNALKPIIEYEFKQKGYSPEQAMLKAQEEIKNIMENEGSRSTYINELKKKELEVTGKILTIERQKTEAGLKLITLNAQNIKLAEQQTSIAEKQVSMIDNFITGIGASVSMRMNVIGLLEKERDLNKENIAILEQQLASKPKDTELQAKLNELKQKDLDITSKIFDQTKNLRDQWISAISASVQGQGMITKVMIDQNQNLAVAQKRLGMLRSSVSGAVTREGEERVGTTMSQRFTVSPTGILGISGGNGAGYRSDVDKNLGIDTIQLSNMAQRGERGNLINAVTEANNRNTQNVKAGTFSGNTGGVGPLTYQNQGNAGVGKLTSTGNVTNTNVNNPVTNNQATNNPVNIPTNNNALSAAQTNFEGAGQEKKHKDATRVFVVNFNDLIKEQNKDNENSENNTGSSGGFNPNDFPKREHGGPVKKGVPYIVGEKRPEIFVPKEDGHIVPDIQKYKDKEKNNVSNSNVKQESNFISNLIENVFGPTFGGMREFGGPVEKGRKYIVGEKKPEVFVPNLKKDSNISRSKSTSIDAENRKLYEDKKHIQEEIERITGSLSQTRYSGMYRSKDEDNQQIIDLKYKLKDIDSNIERNNNKKAAYEYINNTANNLGTNNPDIGKIRSGMYSIKEDSSKEIREGKEKLKELNKNREADNKNIYIGPLAKGILSIGKKVYGDAKTEEFNNNQYELNTKIDNAQYEDEMASRYFSDSNILYKDSGNLQKRKNLLGKNIDYKETNSYDSRQILSDKTVSKEESKALEDQRKVERLKKNPFETFSETGVVDSKLQTAVKQASISRTNADLTRNTKEGIDKKQAEADNISKKTGSIRDTSTDSLKPLDLPSYNPEPSPLNIEPFNIKSKVLGQEQGSVDSGATNDVVMSDSEKILRNNGAKKSSKKPSGNLAKVIDTTLFKDLKNQEQKSDSERILINSGAKKASKRTPPPLLDKDSGKKYAEEKANNMKKLTGKMTEEESPVILQKESTGSKKVTTSGIFGGTTAKSGGFNPQEAAGDLGIRVKPKKEENKQSESKQEENKSTSSSASDIKEVKISGVSDVNVVNVKDLKQGSESKVNTRKNVKPPVISSDNAKPAVITTPEGMASRIHLMDNDKALEEPAISSKQEDKKEDKQETPLNNSSTNEIQSNALKGLMKTNPYYYTSLKNNGVDAYGRDLSRQAINAMTGQQTKSLINKDSNDIKKAKENKDNDAETVASLKKENRELAAQFNSGRLSEEEIKVNRAKARENSDRILDIQMNKSNTSKSNSPQNNMIKDGGNTIIPPVNNTSNVVLPMDQTSDVAGNNMSPQNYDGGGQQGVNQSNMSKQTSKNGSTSLTLTFNINSSNPEDILKIIRQELSKTMN